MTVFVAWLILAFVAPGQKFIHLFCAFRKVESPSNLAYEVLKSFEIPASILVQAANHRCELFGTRLIHEICFSSITFADSD